MKRQQFRRLCLMLRPELSDADIPHRTTVQKHILDSFTDVISNLSQHIQVVL